jgi:ABC-type branched-subunit amino acid transport system ATPase component
MIRLDRATVERSGRIVVDGISLAVPPGEALAVIGRSGAGKTSLLAALAGTLALHSGEITIDGRCVRREPAAVARLVGYAPARLPAWPGIRPREFLELFATAAGLRGKPLRVAVDKALAMAGLDATGTDRLDTLCDGHAKRLLLARALVHDPQVLILDDPFGGLDPLERRDIERLVDDAHLMGRTVVAAVDDARLPGCFTHLAVMVEGRLVTSGPADPAAFDRVGGWTYVVTCPGSAEAAARAVEPLGAEARIVDADTISVRFHAGRAAAGIVAAIVAAGLPVAAAGFDPPWAAQLLEPQSAD